jgi:hypothetical protein
VIRSFEDGITLADLVKKTHKPRSTIRSHRERLLDTGRIRKDGELLIAVGDDDEPSIEDQIDELMREASL